GAPSARVSCPMPAEHRSVADTSIPPFPHCSGWPTPQKAAPRAGIGHQPPTRPLFATSLTSIVGTTRLSPPRWRSGGLRPAGCLGAVSDSPGRRRDEPFACLPTAGRALVALPRPRPCVWRTTLRDVLRPRLHRY